MTRANEMLSAWESLVGDMASGYTMSVYEYSNDLYCREYLEVNRYEESVAAIWSRVEKVDQIAQSFLLPTVGCFHGNHPRSWFWYWGVPGNSPELESDLRARNLI